MSVSRPRSGITLAIMLCAVVSSIAAAAPASTHPCAEEADSAKRLGCYDQAYPPSAKTQEKIAAIARDAFGLQNERKTSSDAARNPDEIQAVISKLHYRGSLRTFTLDNGQVWVQSEAISSGHVIEGDSIRIRKAMLGSYMLLTPSGVGLRVKRAK